RRPVRHTINGMLLVALRKQDIANLPSLFKARDYYISLRGFDGLCSGRPSVGWYRRITCEVTKASNCQPAFTFQGQRLHRSLSEGSKTCPDTPSMEYNLRISCGAAKTRYLPTCLHFPRPEITYISFRGF